MPFMHAFESCSSYNKIPHSDLVVAVLSRLFGAGANILTITQSLPVLGKASVTLTIDVGGMSRGIDALVSALEDLKLTTENAATVYHDGRITNTVGTIVQFKYGEDGIDPSRAVRGDAVNLNDLFAEVLGEDADKLLNVDKKENEGDDYGSREKDLEGFDDDGDYDSDEDSLDSDGDSDYEGGE